MLWTNQRVKTVKDLYDYAVENQEELLGDWQSSSTDYDFWLKYTTDSFIYDRAFCTRYKNWYFFDQTGEETVAEVFQRFTEAVTDFLTLNDKKYTELFKVEMLSVQASSVLSDYTITEELEAERTIGREYTSGERTDNSTDTIGARTDTTTNQVMAYNSSSFVDSSKSIDDMEQQVNTNDFTKGEQIDSEDSTDNLGSTKTTTGTNSNPYENMLKYIEAWDGFSFYTMIFREIAAEFLLV